MKVLIVNQSEIPELLPMHECMDAMAEVLKTVAREEALLPLRQVIWLPDNSGALAAMPSYIPSAMGVKVISVFPGNQNTEYDSHQGAVLLFETKNGRLLSIMDASEITAIRTAAVSGVATRVFARKDASILAIFGSGVQARTHLEAMLVARKIGHVRVWSRNPDHARLFAKRESGRHRIAITAAETGEEAASGADIICTTTASQNPILMRSWVSAGAHINAVGAHGPSARELDTPTIAQSLLYVDRRESARSEAGDFLIPLKEGAISADHIRGELGEVLTGKVQARTSGEEITVFKSLGIAVEDVASAQVIYGKALDQKMGTWIEVGGARHGGD